jgi:hypothetical protein
MRARSSVDRTLPWQGRGRGFESHRVHFGRVVSMAEHPLCLWEAIGSNPISVHFVEAKAEAAVKLKPLSAFEKR